MTYEETQIQIARDRLSESVHNYCNVVFKDDDFSYNERLVAGVQAFIQINYYKESYFPVVGVEQYEEKKWYEFWK